MSDEYEALREALDNFGPKRTTMLLTRDGADAIRRLLSERDALAVDAMRYRWLRTRVSGHRPLGSGRPAVFGFPTAMELPPVGDIMRGSVGQHLDAAIDAAIASTPAAGE